MTIGTWNPTPTDSEENYQLEIDFLRKIIRDMSSTIDISTYLSIDEQKKHAPIMSLDKTVWFSLKESLSTEDIIILIRFFTLAEMTYTNWTANESSPVIWLAKLLRQKGEKIDTQLLQWIKSNTRNKFLPYGAL